MKIDIYDTQGKTVGSTLLPKEIFEVPLNSDLLYQVVSSQISNRRKNIAYTKDRSEVKGGGKKPWRQKGTGRARHGSIRSPIWRGGGITFGPRKERVFKKVIPKKIRHKALFMVLSAKAKDNFLIVLDKLEIEKPNTKQFINIFNNLPCKEKSCLVALPVYNRNIVLSSRNLPKVKTIEARNLTALDLLSSKYLLILKDTIKVIKEKFSESKKTEIKE
ncbi:MAG: 50S ribosomal protein L4 [Candidatus Staskawiczbacteria bacterium CG10_big_fil_rev_8_21_14_0_10_38_10]|uniref:Large ribosomal subunit protein uL4 n=1 Tax=Candidatus Staskawiczbacteria bacterium CG10_big_fil_rev_8_21_14_0_10_38_10 TaxID=1974891 RepID=A0A2H9T211_9BACT|nr:MAG: 50S ribosomal protein L4 [Candidatus Staskawiczbacteria bacterium CG10_big_fil_rev_8_21_14_0_10_38_10]